MHRMLHGAQEATHEPAPFVEIIDRADKCALSGNRLATEMLGNAEICLT